MIVDGPLTVKKNINAKQDIKQMEMDILVSLYW